MIEEILKKLQAQGVNHLVLTSQNDGFKERISLKTEYVEDVRSAVFNAYGMAKMMDKPVVVLVDEEYLPNTYTGLTEAWFQRVPVIILSYNSNSIISSHYLERCLYASFFIEDSNSIDKVVDQILLYHGPTLIKVKDALEVEEPVDYANIFDLLREAKTDANILCYNSREQRKDIKNIEPKHKYGVISKYIGMLFGGKNIILCIPEDLLTLDSNIFNVRNLPANFKLIVKNTGLGFMDKFQEWITVNSIKTHTYDGHEDINAFGMHIKESPVVIFVK